MIKVNKDSESTQNRDIIKVFAFRVCDEVFQKNMLNFKMAGKGFTEADFDKQIIKFYLQIMNMVQQACP